MKVVFYIYITILDFKTFFEKFLEHMSFFSDKQNGNGVFVFAGKSMWIL